MRQLISEPAVNLEHSLNAVRPEYTGIWQAREPHEREWVDEIFGPFLKEHVTDGSHQLTVDNAILFDAFLSCYNRSYYEQFRGRNAFLVHFQDETFEGRYEEIYRNFRGVFRCFWADFFNPEYVMKCPLGYCNGISRAGRSIERASARRYVWSFTGQAAKSSRPDMIKSLVSIDPHFLFATDDGAGLRLPNSVDGKPWRLAPSECCQILLQSAFCPCPMGNVNLECFRLYEALECGSIPIVEKRWTLDYFRELLGEHPIPTVRSWGEARSMIQGMLNNPQEIDALQRRCVDWWDGYKRAYRNQVADFLSRRAADTTLVEGPITTQKFSIPGWREIELLRHHDGRAFARRVQKQALRVFREGKFRVTHR